MYRRRGSGLACFASGVLEMAELSPFQNSFEAPPGCSICLVV